MLLATSSQTGMVGVYLPGEMTWVTPDTADRMAAAITYAAKATRGRG